MKKKLVFLLLISTLVSAPQNVFAEDGLQDTETPQEESASRDVPYYNININGGSFEADANGDFHYTINGQMIKNAFFCDGTYTYYLQNDGTPMKDRLTYHPDGAHIIYFDAEGHEVFDGSVDITKSIEGEPVNDHCYFGTYGYMYVDQIAFDSISGTPYYYNAYGVLQKNGWFQFADGSWGYANRYGKLANNTFGYNPFGQKVFFNWDGRVATGLIEDEFYYYEMDETDGHFISAFPKNEEEEPAWEPASGSMIKINEFDFYILGDNILTQTTIDHNFMSYMSSKYAPKDDWHLWIYKTADGNVSNSETHNSDIFITNRGITIGSTRADVIKAYGERKANAIENGQFKAEGPIHHDLYVSPDFLELPSKEPEAAEQLNSAKSYDGFAMLWDDDDSMRDEPMPWLYYVSGGMRIYYDENDVVIMIEYFYEHTANHVWIS